MNIEFHEIEPAALLKPYIQTYWQGNFNIHNENNFTQSVLPNGCVELIIHLTDDNCFLRKNEQELSASPEFTLIGTYDKPYSVFFEKNVRVFGVRLYPDGVHNFFGVPPAAFLATYEDGGEVLGKQLAELCLKIRSAENVSKQAELADHFFLQNLTTGKRKDSYAGLAMQFIRLKNGLLAYEEITENITIGKRQLQREFKKIYGISMRDYVRLSRMNAIHRYMLLNKGSFTDLSYEMNFADQSHFIREFKEYVGMAPKKFVQRRKEFIVNPVA